MRSKLKLQLFMYMLSVGVLFTMGMDFNMRSNYHSDIYSNSPVNMYSDEQVKHVKAFNIVPITNSLFENLDGATVTTDIQKSTHILIKPTVEKVTTDHYEVTSYYLNVRANMNATSKILNVVKNGDVLEVLGSSDNNWLKLKDGGYVHGKYAKLIRENTKLIGESGIQSIQSTPNKPTTTVKSYSKLTEEQIEQILEGTLLADHGLEQTILETEQEYGINAYFTIAVMKLESGHGKSKLAKEKNNLFGLNAIDGDAFNKAFSFETKGESVEKFGQLISKNYVDKGFTSIEKVASKYCQANPKWSALVMKIMERDYNKIAYN